ncbi:MAG: hypothetical protein N2749_07130 [Clostridia bacterium]|nr:hypothetical protein [Clostridia bacterium]
MTASEKNYNEFEEKSPKGCTKENCIGCKSHKKGCTLQLKAIKEKMGIK